MEQLYKLLKINRVLDPRYPSANSVEEYRENLYDRELSPNVGYWIVGYLLNAPTIDGFVWMQRIVRNGERIDGEFRSSRIQEIKKEDDSLFIFTHNSVYLLEKLSEEQAKKYQPVIHFRPNNENTIW